MGRYRGAPQIVQGPMWDLQLPIKVCFALPKPETGVLPVVVKT